MPINFPDAPIVNQVHSSGGRGWLWDGEKWDSIFNSTLTFPLAEINGGTGVTDMDNVLILATGSTTPHTLADRANDGCRNVIDWGAVMNGTTPDNAAFQATYNATPALATICVPAGHTHIDGFEPVSKFVLFKMDGTYNGTGTTPFVHIGASVVETFLENGTKFYGKQTKGAPVFGPTFRVDQEINHAGGPSGGCEAMRANMWIKNEYTGSMVPVGFAAYVEDQRSTPSGPESIGLLGIAARNNSGVHANIFGANIIVEDRSLALSSFAGSCVGMEITIKANKLDDGLLADGANINSSSGPVAGANRIGLDIKYAHANLGDGSPVSWSNFLNIAQSSPTEPNLSGKNFIRMDGHSTYSAINMRAMICDLHCLVMRSGHTIAWTPQLPFETPGEWNYFTHTSTGVGLGRWRFVHDATEVFSVSNQGLVSLPILPANAANDAAAAGAGVPVGGVYRNGSALMVRVA